MTTPDPFAKTPDATVEQKQGAVGLFMILAWFFSLPVIVGLWMLVGAWAGIGWMLGLSVVAFWASSKAKGGNGGHEGVPDTRLPDADRTD